MLKAAQEHYGCATLTGMLLENQGVAATQGSHWERTIFNNEIMNPIPSNAVSFYSKITLALL